jgi:MFS family permease
VHWQLLSFQSSDLILPQLVKLVGFDAACRIFIVATFAALLGGTAALHRVMFGRIGLWPAATFLLLYNFMFAWGLQSFLFTAGLALMLLAAWIRTAEREGALRSAGFALGALAIFFFHFFAFAILALTVLTFELWRWRRDRQQPARRLILSGAVFVVPAVLLLLAPRSTIPLINLYGNIDDKIRAVLSPFNMYFRWPDYLLGLAAILLFWVLRVKRLLALAAPMRWPLLAVTVAAILVPNQLMSVWGPDFRLPTILLLLLIGGTDLRIGTRKQAAVFAGLVAAMVLVRVGTVTSDWRRMAADFAEFRAATAVLDRGSKVVAVQALLDHRKPPAAILYPYRHIAGFAVIDRDIFLPHLFTVATPLRFIGPGPWSTDQLAVIRKLGWHPGNPAFAAADAKTVAEVEQVQGEIQDFDQGSSTIDWSDWPEQFDYLIDFDYGQPRNPVPALLTELHRGSYFTIFRIHAPQR